MSEQTEPNVVNSDINAEFEANVSLSNIIGNNHAREIATSYIDSYYNEVADGRNPQLSPILLIGHGRLTFAQAISNSFGNLHFKYGYGAWFAGAQLDLDTFFYRGRYAMTSYIDIDQLSIVMQYKLWQILSSRRLNVYDFENQVPINAPVWNGLHIFSAKNTDILTDPLIAKFAIKINLANLTADERYAALKQRTTLLGLTCADSVLMSIAKVSGNIDEGIELLAMAYRIMRSKNDTTMTDAHVNKAFRLMDANIRALSNSKDSAS